MNTALWWLGQNTIAVALLIPLVLLACRVCRNRPAVQHVLWLVVLLKFLTPPIVVWPWSAQEIQESLWPAPVASAEVAELPTEKNRPINPIEPNPATPTVIADRTPERKAIEDPGQPADGPPVERAAQEIGVEQSEAAETPVAPAPERISFADMAVRLTLGVWIGGSVLCLLGQLRRIARHAALVRRGSAAPEQLTAEIALTSKRLGMKPPRAVLARGILSPFMWCLGRLRLIWPATMSSEIEIVRSRGVIAHELAHVRRGDHWVAWLELVAGVVWWWNPLFWLVRRRLRETAEMACDALAIGANPESRREYAELLLELSAGFKTGAPAPVLAVSAGSPSSFERRLSMILSDRVSGKMSGWGLLAAILFALVVLPGWSLGQDRPPSVANDPAPATPKDPRFTPDVVKPADPAVAAEKLDAAAIEAKIQKLEEEIVRLQQLLAGRKTTGSPPTNTTTPANPRTTDDPRKTAADDAKARMVQAEAEYKRAAQLFKQGAITEQQFEAAKKEWTALNMKLINEGKPETASNAAKNPYWTQEREVKFFSLKYARAVDVSRILKDLFPDDEARNPRISADERSNSLIIRGTAKDREALEAIIDRLEQSSAEAIKKGESVKPREDYTPKRNRNSIESPETSPDPNKRP